MSTMTEPVDRSAEIDPVEEARVGIDALAALDARLVTMLAERCRLAKAAGRHERSVGGSLGDPATEAAIVRAAARHARERNLDEELVRRIYWNVIELSRRAREERGA